MFMFNTTYYTAEVLATDVVLTTENDERFYTATRALWQKLASGSSSQKPPPLITSPTA